MGLNSGKIKVKSTAKKKTKNSPWSRDAIMDPAGQWKFPGQITKVPSGDITMEGVNYPVFGVDNLGNEQMMMPGQNYQFPGNMVTEYPMMQGGGTLPTKFTDDRNKIQNYNDSLALRNQFIENKAFAESNPTYDEFNSYWGKESPFNHPAFNRLANKGIAPNGSMYGEYNFSGNPSYGELSNIMEFPKPRQPWEYRASDIEKIQPKGLPKGAQPTIQMREFKGAQLPPQETLTQYAYDAYGNVVPMFQTIPEPSATRYDNPYHKQYGGQSTDVNMPAYNYDQNPAFFEDHPSGVPTPTPQARVRNKGAVKKRVKQPLLNKAYDVVSNPMTALANSRNGIPDNIGQAVRTGNLERNPLEMAVDVVNPAAYANLAGDTYNAVEQGNYGSAAFNAATMIPGLGNVARVGKQAVRRTPQVARNVLSYGNDFVKASRSAGRPQLPTYKQAARWEPDVMPNYLTRGSKTLTPEQQALTGSWYTHRPTDLEFYAGSRPGPGTVKVLRMSATEIADLERQMSGAAKGMSGKSARKQSATSNTFEPGELNVPAARRADAKEIRYDINPTEYIPQGLGATANSPMGRMATGEFMNSMVQGSSRRMGLPRKYFPYQTGGEAQVNAYEQYQDNIINNMPDYMGKHFAPDISGATTGHGADNDPDTFNCIGSSCNYTKGAGADAPIIAGNSNFWSQAERGQIPVHVYGDSSNNDYKQALDFMKPGDYMGHDTGAGGGGGNNEYYPEHSNVFLRWDTNKKGEKVAIMMDGNTGYNPVTKEEHVYAEREYRYDDLVNPQDKKLFFGRPTSVNGQKLDFDYPKSADNRWYFPKVSDETISNLKPLKWVTNKEFDRFGDLNKDQIGRMKSITKALSSRKVDFIKATGMSEADYDDIANIIPGLAYQETKLGKTDPDSSDGWQDLKNVMRGDWKDAARTDFEGLKQIGGKLRNNATSKGILQVKEDMLFNDPLSNEALKRLGITKENYDPGNIEQNTLASMVWFDNTNKNQGRKFDKVKAENVDEYGVLHHGNNKNLSKAEKLLYFYNNQSIPKAGKAWGKSIYNKNVTGFNPVTLQNKKTQYAVKQFGGTAPLTQDNMNYYEDMNYFAGGQPCYECGGATQYQDGGDFSPHMMYDPNTNQGMHAPTYAEHLRMQGMGYGHEQMQQGGENNWIPKNLKKGRCTKGSPNYDCPKGSPQYNLAVTFRNMAKDRKQYGGMTSKAPQNAGINEIGRTNIDLMKNYLTANNQEAMFEQQSEMLQDQLMNNYYQDGGSYYNPNMNYASAYEEQGLDNAYSNMNRDLSSFANAAAQVGENWQGKDQGQGQGPGGPSFQPSAESMDGIPNSGFGSNQPDTFGQNVDQSFGQGQPTNYGFQYGGVPNYELPQAQAGVNVNRESWGPPATENFGQYMDQYTKNILDPKQAEAELPYWLTPTGFAKEKFKQTVSREEAVKAYRASQNPKKTAAAMYQDFTNPAPKKPTAPEKPTGADATVWQNYNRQVQQFDEDDKAYKKSSAAHTLQRAKNWDFTGAPKEVPNDPTVTKPLDFSKDNPANAGYSEHGPQDREYFDKLTKEGLAKREAKKKKVGSGSGAGPIKEDKIETVVTDDDGETKTVITDRNGNIEDAQTDTTVTASTNTNQDYYNTYGQGYSGGNRKIKMRGWQIDPFTGKKERFRYKNKPGRGGNGGYGRPAGYPRKVKNTYNFYNGQPEMQYYQDNVDAEDAYVDAVSPVEAAEAATANAALPEWMTNINYNPNAMEPGTGVLANIPSPYRRDFDPYAKDPYADLITDSNGELTRGDARRAARAARPQGANWRDKNYRGVDQGRGIFNPREQQRTPEESARLEEQFQRQLARDEANYQDGGQYFPQPYPGGMEPNGQGAYFFQDGGFQDPTNTGGSSYVAPEGSYWFEDGALVENKQASKNQRQWEKDQKKMLKEQQTGMIKTKEKGAGNFMDQASQMTPMILPAMDMISSFAELGKAKENEKEAQRLKMADNVFTTSQKTNRGKNTANQGYFDPANMVPVQFQGNNQGTPYAYETFAQYGQEIQARPPIDPRAPMMSPPPVPVSQQQIQGTYPGDIQPNRGNFEQNQGIKYSPYVAPPGEMRETPAEQWANRGINKVANYGGQMMRDSEYAFGGMMEYQDGGTPFQQLVQQYPNMNPSDTLSPVPRSFGYHDANQRAAHTQAYGQTYGDNRPPTIDPNRYVNAATGNMWQGEYDEALREEQAARIPYRQMGGGMDVGDQYLSDQEIQNIISAGGQVEYL